MAMTPTRLVDAGLAQNLGATLQRLREARADGDPAHKPSTCCGVCYICHVERSLNRLVDQIPRKVSA
jgi:hypothetical protein